MSSTNTVTSVPRPVRRQFQSCDSCRQRRRACDAVYLGIGPESYGGACTLCTKKGQQCTFEWLRRSDSHRKVSTVFPHGTRSRPSAAARKSAMRSHANDTGTPPGYSFSIFDDQHLWEADPAMEGNTESNFAPWPFYGLFPPGATPTDPVDPLFLPQTPSSSLIDDQQWLDASRSGLNDPSICVWESSASPIQQSAARAHMSSTNEGSNPPCQKQLRFPSAQALADTGLATRAENRAIANTFLFIYQMNLEHALAAWSTIRTCPYSLATSSPATDSAADTASYNCSSFYERACRMDSTVQRIGLKNIPNLSPSQNELAAQVLHKVVLAFACQWDTAGWLTQNRSASAYSSFEVDLSRQLHQTMQKTLWNDAQTALCQAANLQSFRVIFAQLIFSFIRSPFDAEVRGIASGHAQSPDEPPLSHISMPTDLDAPSTARTTDTCREILSRGIPPSHLETCLRLLLIWRQKLYEQDCNLATAQSFPQSFLNEFNLIYWLAVMCDTTTSAVTGRPPVISDDDCAIQVSSECSMRLNQNEEDVSVVRAESSQQRLSSTHLRNKRSIPIWTNRLLNRSFDPIGNLNWPVPEIEVAKILKEAIPVKVLLFRRVAHLQALVGRSAAESEVERAIQDSLQVYQQWQAQYGSFMHQCSTDVTLAAHLWSWHVILSVHWHYGVILLSEAIASVDEQRLGNPQQMIERLETSTATNLAIASAIQVTRLALANSREKCVLAPDHQLDAMLSEPWSEIMVRSLAAASITLLDACQNCNEHSMRGVGRDEIILGVQACVGVLRHLGGRCSPATQVARMLECMIGFCQ